MSKEQPVPPAKLLDLLSRFLTRTDELLGYLAEMEKRRDIRDQKILEALQSIAGKALPPLGVVEIGDESIKALTARLVQLPNRIDRIEIDTSKTAWDSLRDAGKIAPPAALGFWVEDVGGGFDYKIMRQGKGPDKPRTAAVDDKWDQEFDDIQVKGSGAGTAILWIWWRE